MCHNLVAFEEYLKARIWTISIYFSITLLYVFRFHFVKFANKLNFLFIASEDVCIATEFRNVINRFCLRLLREKKTR